MVCISASDRVELPLEAQLGSSASSSSCADRHRGQVKLVSRAEFESVERQRPDNHLLDGVVGQHLGRQQRELAVAGGGSQYFCSVRTASAFSPGRPVRPACFGPRDPSRPAWAARESRCAGGGRRDAVKWASPAGPAHDAPLDDRSTSSSSAARSTWPARDGALNQVTAGRGEPAGRP